MNSLVLDRASTILDCLEHYAAERPEAAAYIFLPNGEGDERVMTYRQLQERAQWLGADLHRRGLQGKTVLLLFPTGLEFISAFFGCLYAGAIAVPCNLARNSHHYQRLQQIAVHSRAAAVLTTQPLTQVVTDGLRGSGVDTDQVQVLCEPRLPERTGIHNLSKPEPAQLAFLQYTSGSTGQPKGVIVTHAQLIANERAIQQVGNFEEYLPGGGWLPQFHDMGLIGATLQPIALGGRYVFMPPLHFLQRPLRWLQILSRYRLKATAAPNFALDLCVKAPLEGYEGSLDLSDLHTIMCGAEPVKAETLTQFTAKFAPFSLRADVVKPCYGLAEATLIVTGGLIGDKPRHVMVSRSALAGGQIQITGPDTADVQAVVCCGRSIEHHRTVIVDPHTRRVLADRELGEVWFSGPSVAMSYWGNASATEATFQAYTACGQGPFMRTGDLGFLHHGGLFITGRIKELIIIRGRNYFPHDIEFTLIKTMAAMAALADVQAAVFGDDDAHAPGVVAYLELPRRLRSDINFDAVAKQLRHAIAQTHDVQLKDLFVLTHGNVPRTSSGKTQRLHCSHLYRSGEIHRCADIVYATQRHTTVRSMDNELLREKIARLMRDQR